MKNNTENLYEYFEVAGAGNIQISIDPTCSTGGAKGFSFGVQWGRHGYTGGVIDKEEAIKLAKHIMRSINLNELKI